MAVIELGALLSRHAGGDKHIEVDAATLGEAIEKINAQYPGFKDLVVGANENLDDDVVAFFDSKHEHLYRSELMADKEDMGSYDPWPYNAPLREDMRVRLLMDFAGG